jgi:hypothetical protein
MADRYWVLGTGSWSSTNTVNWSASSGGAGGASVPTASDNVFFDANSNVGTGAFTVTMANTPRVCNDFTASGLDGTMTLAGTSIGLTVSGSLTFQATNFTRTYTGTTTFNATTTGKTVTTNGVSFGSTVTFDGVGGGWSLGSAFSGTIITLTNGTFDLAGYTTTLSLRFLTATGTKNLTFNGGTIVCTGASTTAFNNAAPTNFTTTAGTGTGTISMTSASGKTFVGGGSTFNCTLNQGGVGTLTIAGSNTFSNLSGTAPTSPGVVNIAFAADQTINGTLTVSAGTASAYRTFIRSDTIGTTRTLTCAAVSLTDVDFRDITIAGAASPATGTRLGDAKGNSGITFPAAKTVYYRQTGSADWGATGSGSWSATSGGALDATMFPLAQDTAVFPAATYPASGSTTTFNAAYQFSTIDMSLRTSNTMTLETGGIVQTIYGNWINGTGITLSGANTITFSGRGSQTITSAGRTFTQFITINCISGSLILQDAFLTNSIFATNLARGTLDLQSYTFSTPLFTASNSNTRTIAFGTGQISCTGTGTAWDATTTTGLTVTGTGTISLTSATAKTFAGGGFSYSGITLNQGGAGALTITGSNTFGNITNTRKSVSATSILFTAGTTSTFTDWNASGESTRLLTIGSVTAASHTLSKASGTVSSDFLSISRSTATGGAGWYAGANSTNGGNNSGWIFTAPPAPSAGNGNFLVFF